jgi:cell wall-associated NlpC family hydrolase
MPPGRGFPAGGVVVVIRLAAVGVLVPLVATVGLAFAATGSGALDPAADGAVQCIATSGAATPGTSGAEPSGAGVVVAGTTLDAAQLANARTVRDVGVALGIPARGHLVALATAMTESGLRNLSHGDADSLGLFQQRPSTGWGTPAQIMDPVHAATSFYRALEQVPDWQTLPVTVAAQRVQRSAFPDRYAAWEPLATALVTSMAGTATACAALPADTPLPGDLAGSLPPGFTLPAGTPLPVATAITWALGQLGTPYQWGGTCTDPHGPLASRRCDCSSLTQAAYRAAGVTLTRTTYTQIREGVEVPDPAHLQPGDLIFLPGHVGLYLGAGLVVHAPHTGDTVKISALQPYWTSHWVTARRVV